MQQIIGCKIYHTDRAEQIAKYGTMVNKSDFHALAETLLARTHPGVNL